MNPGSPSSYQLGNGGKKPTAQYGFQQNQEGTKSFTQIKYCEMDLGTLKKKLYVNINTFK